MINPLTNRFFGRISFVLIAMSIVVVGAQASHPGDPQKVAEVIEGMREEANAAWWGFDPEDSTQFLQEAIDSGVARLILPNMGADWVVRPIFLRSDLQLILEEGVIVTAKKGEFHGTNDSLFTLRDVENVVITGYGATMRMHRDDYTSPEYRRAQWRMGISVRGSTNIEISGLTIRDTGGDGIYLGRGKKKYNENIVIRDIVADNNYRQGISVISVKNLLIENSVFKNTEGTAPMAGIDIEPNFPDESLENIVVRNSVFEGNEGPGIMMYLKNLSSHSEDISILWENILVLGGKYGYSIDYGNANDYPKGEIVLRNCIIEDSFRNGIHVYNKQDDGALKVKVEDCTLHNVGINDNVNLESLGGSVPIYLSNEHELGGIYFNNVVVVDGKHRPALYAELRKPMRNDGFSEIQGALHVLNPHGAEMRWDGSASQEGTLILSEIDALNIAYDQVIVLEDYAIPTLEVMKEPTVHFVRPSSVNPVTVVSRTFNPYIEMLHFDADDVKLVEVLVDDNVIYSGSFMPIFDEIDIDTTTLIDGHHFITVVAHGESGHLARGIATFSTRNFKAVVDPFEGAKQVAWFGEVYNPVTIDQSNGWTYASDLPEEFFGDRHRKLRLSNTTEYLVWETPSLIRLEITAYVKGGNIDGILTIEGSLDQKSWHRMPVTVDQLERSSSGWEKILIKGESDPENQNAFVRLILSESKGDTEIQLGQATFQLLRDNPVD